MVLLFRMAIEQTYTKLNYVGNLSLQVSNQLYCAQNGTSRSCVGGPLVSLLLPHTIISVLAKTQKAEVPYFVH